MPSIDEALHEHLPPINEMMAQAEWQQVEAQARAEGTGLLGAHGVPEADPKR